MFLYPILSLPNISSFFQDQFAFRPTGSTTASLIFLIHNITSLLQHNQHVHVISFDFSKAFDSVRHHSLIQKISKFPIPDFLYNWLVSFFNDRSHCTKIGGIISSVLGINASVVQGSGLGPISFVFNASDLHPLNPANKICKYADDFYLIVPSSHSHTIPAELENIAIWAKNNNLKLNQSKSHEMIVRRPRAGSSTNPPCHHTWDQAGSRDGSAWCNAHGHSLIPLACRSHCCPYSSNFVCSTPPPVPWPRCPTAIRCC